MNELKTFMGDSVDLSSMFPEPITTFRLPASTIEDRAVKLADLTQPAEQLVPTFQGLVAEANVGQDFQMKALEARVIEKSGKSDLAALSEIMGSREYSVEQKKAALDEYNNKRKSGGVPLNKEVAAKHLSSPSPDPKEDEEKVRDWIASGNVLNEVLDNKEKLQALVNSAAADLQNTSGTRTFLELMEVSLLPFANNKAVADTISSMKKKQGKGGALSFAKDFIDAGGSMMDLRQAFANVPAAQREEFLKSLLDTIKSDSGVILSSDNHYAKFQKYISITDPEGYSNTERWLDTLLPVFDIMGIADLFKGAKAMRGGKAATVDAKTLEANLESSKRPTLTSEKPQEAPQSIFEGQKVSTPPEATGKLQTRITNLEEERAALLGDSSQLLDNGQVRQINQELNNLKRPDIDVKTLTKEYQANQKLSFKEAKSRAEKDFQASMAEYEASKARLEGMLEGNVTAAKNEQRLAELDKQIEDLKGQMGVEAGGSVLTELADSIRRIEWNSYTGRHNPTAMANIVGTVNPGAGRVLFKAVAESPDDNLARALYGTSKQDAITSQLMPQATTPKGPVLAKLPDPEKELRKSVMLSDDIKDTIESVESIGLTKGERASQRAAVIRQFHEATGLELHPNMSSFGKDDANGRFHIGATYGLPTGGFPNAVDAVMQTKLSLRRFGISEDQITILQRKGDQFVPVDKKNIPEGEGEFYARVDLEHNYDITDLTAFENLDVKRNLFDNHAPLVWNDRGSFNRYVADPASTLNPAITSAASAVADRTSRLEKYMLELANEYATAWKKLPKDQKKVLDEYIINANFNGISPNASHMTAQGLTAEAQQAVYKWRQYWDTHYHLENMDVVRTLNNEGVMVLENANAKLFGKEIPKNRNIDTVYDPTLDQVRQITPQEIDALYANNGTLVSLRRPENINGQAVEYMLSRNSPTEYMRKVTPNDSVLNYREGYFQIQYRAARFVDEITVGAGGKKIRKAVAVAGDTQEAQHFVNRMKSTNPGVEYVIRSDERAMVKGSNDWWDVNSASGRIAQRHRGKTLEDSSGLNHLGDHNYIVNPAEAAVKSARSISGRTMMRPMLEQAKVRFMRQYDDFIPEVNGVKKFPTNISEISAKGNFTSKEIADARTTWEYLRYLENGYINAADQMTRSFWNWIAETGAKWGTPKVERFAQTMVESGGLTSLAKNSVFMATIGTNPLRQLIVQPNQVIRLYAYTGFKGDSVIDIVKAGTDYLNWAVTGKAMKPENVEMFKFIEKSGMLSAVDRSNLVRGALTDAAQMHGPITGAASKGLNFMRKIGFDLGEQANLASHLIAAYRKYEKLGWDMKDADTLLKVQAEARAISYEMNFAGDMPYNQGSLAFALQFLQVPHKAFLQYANRKLDRATRARLLAADVVFWGPPTALVTAMINNDLLPEDKPETKFVRELVIDGLESAFLNHVIQKLGGEDQGKIDFSAFDPHNIDGWKKFYEAFMTGGVAEVIANSPTGSLFLKNGSRGQNVIEKMGRWFNGEVDETLSADSLISVVTEVAKISSGFNNAWKASQMLRLEQAIDAKGSVVDDKATKLDALAQLFGFTSYDRAAMMKMSMEVRKNMKDEEKEAFEQYDAIKRYYTDKIEKGTQDPAWIQNVGNWIVTSHKGNPEMQQKLYARLGMDIRSADDKFFRMLHKASGYKTAAELRAQIEMSGISPEAKKEAIRMVSEVQSVKEETK